MSNIVVHIPHAGLRINKEFINRIIIDKKEFIKESIYESDFLINLFKPFKHTVYKSRYSRMLCDVERFKENEVMDQYGMGIVYEKDSNGNNFISLDNNYTNTIIKYYDNYHNNFNKLIDNILNKYGKCLIIDLHSFSDEYVYGLFKKKNCKDICIGVNDDNYSQELLELTIKHFKDNGYIVDINYPYCGTIIPNNHLDIIDNRIISMMIEVNKRVYLDNTYKKLDIMKSIKLKRCLDKLYRIYEEYMNWT